MSPINPDCPRIAHESGVVLGCQVDHVERPTAPHGTVTGEMWGDDDDRIAHAALEPHHRRARFRAGNEERLLSGPQSKQGSPGACYLEAVGRMENAARMRLVEERMARGRTS